MKKILSAFILAAMLFGIPFYASTVNAANDYQVQKGYITVSYTFEKEVSPDTAEFSLAVKTSDKKSMNEASTKNKEISNKIYNYIKSNINTANGDYVKTSNYSATPVYIYNNGKRIFEKYEVSNNIIVHTKTLDKVSTIIDKSIELGATNVNSLNFTLSDKDSACEEMLSKASAQVRRRANIVTQAVGSSVEGIKELRTSCSLNQRRTNYAYTNMRLMKSAGASMDEVPEAVSTDIEAGNITIYANVDAEFYVK